MASLGVTPLVASIGVVTGGPSMVDIMACGVGGGLMNLIIRPLVRLGAISPPSDPAACCCLCLS